MDFASASWAAVTRWSSASICSYSKRIASSQDVHVGQGGAAGVTTARARGAGIRCYSTTTVVATAASSAISGASLGGLATYVLRGRYGYLRGGYIDLHLLRVKADQFAFEGLGGSSRPQTIRCQTMNGRRAISGPQNPAHGACLPPAVVGRHPPTVVIAFPFRPRCGEGPVGDRSLAITVVVQFRAITTSVLPLAGASGWWRRQRHLRPGEGKAESGDKAAGGMGQVVRARAVIHHAYYIKDGKHVEAGTHEVPEMLRGGKGVIKHAMYPRGGHHGAQCLGGKWPVDAVGEAQPDKCFIASFSADPRSCRLLRRQGREGSRRWWCRW